MTQDYKLAICGCVLRKIDDVILVPCQWHANAIDHYERATRCAALPKSPS